MERSQAPTGHAGHCSYPSLETAQIPIWLGPFCVA